MKSLFFGALIGLLVFFSVFCFGFGICFEEGISLSGSSNYYLNKKSLTFHSATVDARKYYRLFNHISLAGRLFYGTNWGKNAQKFRLGGVPWIFSSDSIDNLSNKLTICAV